jgi:hypothetical protein
MEEKLDQALEWNCNHQPQISDLEALETQLSESIIHTLRS